MSDRIAKVNKLFKQEVGRAILEDVDFPVNFVVTVIRVDTSLDLHYADVFVSVMPKEKAEEAMDILDGEIYGIQQKINKKMFMKPVPMIRFKLDRSGDNVDRINEIINEDR